MMKVKQIAEFLESVAPLAFQEPYDNAGLIVGNLNDAVSGVLVTLDVTEDVVDEAIAKGADLIVSHHPVVFGGIKKLNGNNYIERCVIKAIKNNIAIYASHTNFDSIHGGVNTRVCEKLELCNCRILSPMKNFLKKLVTFVPTAQAEQVRDALFKAGAGSIGNYGSCSYNLTGSGTFKANDQAHPFVGEKNEFHTENEIRIETIFPKHLQSVVIQALLKNHPYEEVAYDVYPLDNEYEQVGTGMIGEFVQPIDEIMFLGKLKNVFHCQVVKHTALLGKPVRKVAVCGGSGSDFLKAAMAQKADVFVSADYKYHQFFDAERKILIADIGHFESEQFTKEVFYELLTKKFSKFAVHLSEVNTNPVNYFI